MNRIVEAVKENGVYFIATTDGTKAQVRPFGTIEEIDGVIYIQTSNQKECFKQMMSHPQIQISSMGKDGSWIRLDAFAEHVDSLEIREKFLELEPNLKAMYSADDGKCAVIALRNPVCMKYSFTGAPVEIK